MSDRITRDVSGSSSDSEASGEPANVGEGRSPLGAVGQDRNVKSSKSGDDGRSSRGSLTSPGHAESRGLGARPRRKTEEKEGKGSKHHHHTGKGTEWNKKDRRAARVHRGKGQKIAAERAAVEAAERAAKDAKDTAEGKGKDKSKDDGSG
ncbi:hypothetical protein, partial [Candidatus Ichthyocystis sparus]|uniref:hypothetical protein n=1 Tax=Candidatus Ichthyocystis sparus TaxID=1561004 RepID=UPI001F5ED97D